MDAMAGAVEPWGWVLTWFGEPRAILRRGGDVRHSPVASAKTEARWMRGSAMRRRVEM
jgi:hypothetical protein